MSARFAIQVCWKLSRRDWSIWDKIDIKFADDINKVYPDDKRPNVTLTQHLCDSALKTVVIIKNRSASSNKDFSQTGSGGVQLEDQGSHAACWQHGQSVSRLQIFQGSWVVVTMYSLHASLLVFSCWSSSHYSTLCYSVQLVGKCQDVLASARHVVST